MPLKYIRIFFIANGLIMLFLAVGFFFQMEWAKTAWPWVDGRLSYMFLASILAAIAAPTLWVSLSGEWGAAGSSALFPLIAFAGMALFLFQLSPKIPLIFALVLAFLTLYSLGILLWARPIALRDTRQLPRFVRLSFIIFALVLVAAGLALALKMPNIMPWPITDESAVMFGWIFIGASSSYIFGAINPRWNYARAPLLGFLVYDLVLIPPLISHLSDVKPENQLSLLLYLAVLIYSALLAIYYLFINRETRSWAVHEALT